MRLTLSDGREIKVGCRHGEVKIHVPTTGQLTVRRGTTVWLDDAGGAVKVETFSACQPPDHFSKKVGRRLAASRLLCKLRKVYTKEDRRRVFQILCPEYK